MPRVRDYWCRKDAPCAVDPKIHRDLVLRMCCLRPLILTCAQFGEPRDTDDDETRWVSRALLKFSAPAVLSASEEGLTEDEATYLLFALTARTYEVRGGCGLGERDGFYQASFRRDLQTQCARDPFTTAWLCHIVRALGQSLDEIREVRGQRGGSCKENLHSAARKNFGIAYG